MDYKMSARFFELCELLGIKTVGDLKRFEDEHRLFAPNGEQLINALEKEIMM